MSNPYTFIIETVHVAEEKIITIRPARWVDDLSKRLQRVGNIRYRKEYGKYCCINLPEMNHWEREFGAGRVELRQKISADHRVPKRQHAQRIGKDSRYLSPDGNDAEAKQDSKVSLPAVYRECLHRTKE